MSKFRLFSSKASRTLERCRSWADEVERAEEDTQRLSDAALRLGISALRERHRGGESLDALLPETFAIVREAAIRTLGERPHFEQIVGAAALHLGSVVEMRTGEGKTLTAVLTACLHALAGNGVHVLTANDYLAARDADWMGPVYSFLGFRRTLVTGDDKPAERRELYAADVVYGTANAFAYDYLRDNMVHTRADVVQRGHFSAIVDEADLVMLDAAALLPQISGPADVTPDYAGPAAFVVRLQRGAHYTVDEARRAVSLTEAGMAVVEAWHGGAVDAAFFLSFEDPHLRLPGPAANVDVIETDGPILSRVVRRAVAAKLTALSTVEISRLTYNLRYAAVREEQRATLYTRRADILNNGLTRDQVDGIIADVMRSLVLDARTGPQDVDRLSSALADHYPSTISRDTIAAGLAGNSTSKTRADLVEAVVRDAHAAAAARESELGAEVAAALAQRVMLSVMDRRWRAQLQDLQDAEESPSLRGLGVDGALAAYQRTAERLAVEMWEKIDTEFVGYWFNLEVTVG